jgi:glycosyltransferase involved in cell wall biosynthesis
MKLLVYSHYFAPSVGGVETIVRSLASGLSELRTPEGKQEFDLTLITQTPAESFHDDVLNFTVVRQPSFLQTCNLILKTNTVHVAGPALVPMILGLLFHKPVVIEHHGFQVICPTGQLLQEPQNIPCPGHFMTGHHNYCLRCSLQPRRLASFRLWLLTFFRRFLCQQVAVNIAPTTWLAAQLQLPRTETVWHGLAPSAPLVRSSGYRHVPVLTFLGRIVTTKGVRLLLNAAHLLKLQNRAFKLSIVGDGPERSAMEELANVLGLSGQVCFLGCVPQSQISETLSRTDVLVVPSLGGEVFGMALAENMMRGLPVLASDLGAFIEVLGDAGKTFSAGDPADLAQRIGECLDDPVGAQRLGVAGHQRVLDFFGLGRMIEGHARIYRSLATEKARQ